MKVACSTGAASLTQNDPRYPGTLETFLGDEAPPALTALGTLELLHRKPLALFCSVKCPGNLILKTYDFARTLRDAGATVIGGFHSPMEKECLAVLLRGTQPVVVCPARSVHEMRVPAGWRKPLADGRLLILSPFEPRQDRATADLAERRNRFIAAIAGTIFVAYAAPGGKTEGFCREVLAWGKPVLTLDAPENAGLIALGAQGIRPDLESMYRFATDLAGATPTREARRSETRPGPSSTLPTSS